MFGRKKQATPPVPADSSADQQPRISPRSPSEAIKPMAAPPPPPSMRKPRRGALAAVSGFLTLLVALAGARCFGLTVLEREVTAKGPLGNDKVVLIPRNTGTSEIAEHPEAGRRDRTAVPVRGLCARQPAARAAEGR